MLLKTFKEMKKSDRGSFDFCSDDRVYFCGWNDNSIINIESNYQLSMCSCRRTSFQKDEILHVITMFYSAVLELAFITSSDRCCISGVSVISSQAT